MMTDPKIEQRSDQHYAGIRAQVHMSEFDSFIPKSHQEVYDWLKSQGIAPASAPFMRYHVLNMSGDMDVEVGVTVASPIGGNDRVKPGILPAGSYVTTVYTGLDNGVEATRRLLEWADKEGLVWDTYESDKGDGFISRNEFFLTEPDNEPNTAEWETEIAIRLADPQS